jgi:hypothetical protein
MDFGMDVESAKQTYLAQWEHCIGKRITAVDSALVCDCKARFPWTRALGEAIVLAESSKWLKPVISSESEQQPELFA